MYQAEEKGKRFLCRTAAAFVSARIGHRPCLVNPHDLGIDSQPSGLNGGLVVVGSYVPKTTSQVNNCIHLQNSYGASDIDFLFKKLPLFADGPSFCTGGRVESTVWRFS